jgi:hypothetical protein
MFAGFSFERMSFNNYCGAPQDTTGLTSGKDEQEQEVESSSMMTNGDGKISSPNGDDGDVPGTT